jgi:hypothetical protein
MPGQKDCLGGYRGLGDVRFKNKGRIMERFEKPAPDLMYEQPGCWDGRELQEARRDVI